MDFKKNQAIYLQIADYVCENILTQQWPEGERLLSVREMASNIQVNPNTVMNTYKNLQGQGLIYHKRGIGYFIAEDALQKAQDMKKDEFVSEFLPHVFRTMDLLKMSFPELEKIYKKNKNGKK